MLLAPIEVRTALPVCRRARGLADSAVVVVRGCYGGALECTDLSRGLPFTRSLLRAERADQHWSRPRAVDRVVRMDEHNGP